MKYKQIEGPTHPITKNYVNLSKKKNQKTYKKTRKEGKERKSVQVISYNPIELPKGYKEIPKEVQNNKKKERQKN